VKFRALNLLSLFRSFDLSIFQFFEGLAIEDEKECQSLKWPTRQYGVEFFKTI
jgi:hypothetical protein